MLRCSILRLLHCVKIKWCVALKYFVLTLSVSERLIERGGGGAFNGRNQYEARVLGLRLAWGKAIDARAYESMGQTALRVFVALFVAAQTAYVLQKFLPHRFPKRQVLICDFFQCMQRVAR